MNDLLAFIRKEHQEIKQMIQTFFDSLSTEMDISPTFSSMNPKTKSPSPTPSFELPSPTPSFELPSSPESFPEQEEWKRLIQQSSVLNQEIGRQIEEHEHSPKDDFPQFQSEEQDVRSREAFKNLSQLIQEVNQTTSQEKNNEKNTSLEPSQEKNNEKNTSLEPSQEKNEKKISLEPSQEKNNEKKISLEPSQEKNNEKKISLEPSQETSQKQQRDDNSVEDFLRRLEVDKNTFSAMMRHVRTSK